MRYAEPWRIVRLIRSTKDVLSVVESSESLSAFSNRASLPMAWRLSIFTTRSFLRVFKTCPWRQVAPGTSDLACAWAEKRFAVGVVPRYSGRGFRSCAAAVG